MNPKKAFLVIIGIWSISIPLMAIPDVLAPHQGDSTNALLTAIGAAIVLLGHFILLLVEHNRRQSEILDIEKKVASKCTIIARGSIRFEIGFWDILKRQYPALLAHSETTGYMLFALIDDEVRVIEVHDVHISTTYSNMLRDCIKYIKFMTQKGVVYFAPTKGMHIIGQNDYADSIVNNMNS